MYNDILKTIEKFDSIVIYRHTRPDGDALGSQLGLREIIKINFPQKNVYVVGDMTLKYSFMGTMDELDEDFEYEKTLAFLLDCSERNLFSNQNFRKSAKTIKIDHHIRREEFGDIEVVNETFESCCGLVAEIAFELGLEVTPLAAQHLYTGIITDSGRFRYDSTSSRTFEICSKLLEKKFDMMSVYDALYIEDLDNVLLRARYTLKMQFTKNKVAYIYTTKEEVEKEKVDMFTISRAIVSTMSGIKGINIWANFTEDLEDKGVIVEIRSSKYNINPIALKYGGGGHAKASGATVPSKEIAFELLADLDKLALGENNE